MENFEVSQSHIYDIGLEHTVDEISCSGVSSLDDDNDNDNDNNDNNNVGDDDDDDDDDDDLSHPVVIPNTLPPPVLRNEIMQMTPVKRSFEEAVLYACNQVHQPRQEQNKTLWIVDNMDLKSVSIMNEEGVEENLLGSQNIINNLAVFKHLSCTGIVQDKCERIENVKCSCNRLNTTSLNLPNIIYNSPYKTISQEEIRAASCVTTNHDHRPYTIFTLCDYNSGDYSDGIIVSKLFRKIALEVLTKEQPKLKKDLIKKFQQNCSKGRVEGSFDEIIKLFKKQQ